MQPAFPARQVANLMLTAALVWLHFAGGGGPFVAGPVSVLIVEETADRVKLTPAQREVIEANGPDSVRAYCKTHCRKSADGLPQFRVIDKDSPVSQDEPWVQSLMKEPRQSVPWIYISSGAGKFSGPVDDTTKATLKRWGGA